MSFAIFLDTTGGVVTPKAVFGKPWGTWLPGHDQKVQYCSAHASGASSCSERIEHMPN